MNANLPKGANAQTGCGARPFTIYQVLDHIPIGIRSNDDHLVRLIEGISMQGWEAAFAFGGEPGPEFRDDMRKWGATYIVIPFPLTWRGIWRIAKELRRKRPAILVTHFISPFTFRILALKLLGLAARLVVIDHSSGAVSPKVGVRRLLARLRGWFAGRIIDRILPVSDANARRDVEEVYLPAGKVQRIHNGIVLERFQPVAKRLDGPVRIAFAGQLIPAKGVLTLLRAFQRLEGDVELSIAGRGVQEAELREFCRAGGLNRVRFVGYITTIAELFAGSDVVVVPSEWEEAFGLVAAEAMACGAAVVVSDAGGLPEVVGDAGLVFHRGDAEDLESKLRQLIESPEICRELGKKARRRVEQLFTEERRREALLATFRDMCLQVVPSRGAAI
jgi:glycosyltransferase involved in cell wall biosynthesis